MKFIMIILIFSSTLSAKYWGANNVAYNGLSMETVCKNGYLTDVITGNYKGNNIKIEQSHCVDTSSWDGDCLHKPIKCYEKQNKEK